MHRRTRWTVAAAAACLLVGGCAPQPGQEVPEPGTSRSPVAEGGPGLPVQPAVRALQGERTELVGTLRVEDDGCFTWETYDGELRWVVWPPNAEHDGAQVVLKDGTAVGAGDVLAGSGFLADADVLPEWDVADSYFRAFGDFCRAGERGVVVLDKVRLAGG